jgi:hypothetical protein
LSEFKRQRRRWLNEWHVVRVPDKGVVQVEASFPADGQALVVAQEREGLLDDVAELAQALHRALMQYRGPR